MKINILRCVPFCFILLTFVNCEKSANSSDEANAIRSNWNLFIENWNRLNADGCMEIYFDDAVLIPSQLSILAGKQAIGEFYNDLFAMNKSADYTHKTESLTFSENVAIELGSFSVDWISAEGDSSTYHARALVHWQRDDSGNWKIKQLLFNNPPPL